MYEANIDVGLLKHLQEMSVLLLKIRRVMDYILPSFYLENKSEVEQPEAKLSRITAVQNKRHTYKL